MNTQLAEELRLESAIFGLTQYRDAAALSKAGGMGILGTAGPKLERIGRGLDTQ